jgi:hypothetical protein
MGYRIAKRGRYWWIFGRVKGTRLDASLRLAAMPSLIPPLLGNP